MERPPVNKHKDNPGWYHYMEVLFAAIEYGFPADPKDGQQQEGSDGSRWTFNLHGTELWDLVAYAPDQPERDAAFEAEHPDEPREAKDWVDSARIHIHGTEYYEGKFNAEFIGAPHEVVYPEAEHIKVPIPLRAVSLMMLGVVGLDLFMAISVLSGGREVTRGIGLLLVYSVFSFSVLATYCWIMHLKYLERALNAEVRLAARYDPEPMSMFDPAFDSVTDWHSND